jgi:Methyltransferase domain
VDAAMMQRKSAEGGYHFHLVGLGSVQQSRDKERLGGGPLRTLQEMMEELGHSGRAIDVLKVDCEMCEWVTLRDQLLQPLQDHGMDIGQLLLEMHLYKPNRVRLFRPIKEFFTAPTPMATIVDFFEQADSAQLRIFHKERNPWCDGYKASPPL